MTEQQFDTSDAIQAMTALITASYPDRFSGQEIEQLQGNIRQLLAAMKVLRRYEQMNPEILSGLAPKLPQNEAQYGA